MMMAPDEVGGNILEHKIMLHLKQTTHVHHWTEMKAESEPMLSPLYLHFHCRYYHSQHAKRDRMLQHN